MTSYSKVVRHVDAYTETTRPSLDSIENGRLFLVETYYKDNFSTPTVLPAIIQGAGERRPLFGAVRRPQIRPHPG